MGRCTETLNIFLNIVRSDHSDTLDLFIKQGADGEIIFIKFCCEKCPCKNLTWPLDPDDAADEADFGAHPVFIRPNAGDASDERRGSTGGWDRSLLGAASYYWHVGQSAGL